MIRRSDATAGPAAGTTRSRLDGSPGRGARLSACGPGAVALVAAMVMAGLGGGDGSQRGAPVSVSTSHEPATPPSSTASINSAATGTVPVATSEPVPEAAPSLTTTSAPPGTDVGAVTPILVELLRRYDATVSAILADPRVASDHANDDVVNYLALFTPGNEFAQDVLAFWAAEGEGGRFYRPGPSRVMLSTVVESVTPVSADEVTVIVCNHDSFEIVDATGVVVESSAGRVPGTVTAVRVHGEWLLQDLTQGPEAECAPPSTTVELGTVAAPESTVEPASTVGSEPRAR